MPKNTACAPSRNYLMASIAISGSFHIEEDRFLHVIKDLFTIAQTPASFKSRALFHSYHEHLSFTGH